MFQDFEDHADPKASAPRLTALRAALEERDLTGFLVPRADEHQGEYVPACAERLAWLTGFTGSAGLAIVLADEAAVFVDGRYTLQVRDQVDTALVTPVALAETSPSQWIETHLKSGDVLGYDPWLHTPDEIERLGKAAAQAGAKLQPVTPNPLDQVWHDRPPPPGAPVLVHDLTHAGTPSSEKRAEVGKIIVRNGADAAVLTLPDSIAWLLNIRGHDVKHTPLPLSYAIAHGDGHAELFIAPEKITADVSAHLGNEVTLHTPAEFVPALGALKDKVVQIDPATASMAILQTLENAGVTVKRAADPCLLPKACKNDTEVAGARSAHVRDGAALTRFLAWIAREGTTGIDEITAVKKLEEMRRETRALKDISFDTISGSGANGAIVHYRVTTGTNRTLQPGELFLVDSGGQYTDGTTDVTRTVAIGTPPAEARERFTLVLKGHIQLAMARFPEGTTGMQLDTLARLPLWAHGFDFDHGTGHGVGSFLSVHEGPQRISKGGHGTALKPGMIVSNEPGYYKSGAYGIRIENLMVVTPPEPVADGERAMLGFETLTLAPIDRALIVPDMLLCAEREWLNAYHARVRQTLSPLVDEATRAWLAEATAEI